METVRSDGSGIWEVGLSGLQTERFRRVTLTRSCQTERGQSTYCFLSLLFVSNNPGHLLFARKLRRVISILADRWTLSLGTPRREYSKAASHVTPAQVRTPDEKR